MAEARSAVTEPRVHDLNDDVDSKKSFLAEWRRSLLKRFFRTRNLIRNGMWPTSLWNLALAVILIYATLINDWSFTKPVTNQLWKFGKVISLHEGIPLQLRALLISCLFGVKFFVVLLYIRRWLLQILLSYRGWMYTTPRSHSLKIMVWGLIVRFISGYSPTTYSYQKSLPCLPVPKLRDTLRKLMVTLKPLLGETSEEYQKLKQQSKEFEKSLGKKFQRVLVLKSWWAQNWITDWWEKYVYLYSRTSVSINSNYYVLDGSQWTPTHRPVSRAAVAIHKFMHFKRMIDHENLPPLVIRKTIPLCMAQYEKMFSTTRIAGVDSDTLLHSAESKHVTVMHKGIYYRLEVFDAKNQILSKSNLEKQLQWIVDDAEKHQGEYSEGAKALAALTGIERSDWAQVREQFFSSGINKESLSWIETGIFNVVIDTRECPTWTDRGKHLLHADGKTIWFDKNFNIVVNADAHCGVNGEHSWGDAPALGHVIEYFMTQEILDTDSVYDKDGYCVVDPSITQASMKTPDRLLWDVPHSLETKIMQSVAYNVKNNEDLQLYVKEFTSYGKGFIKTCKVSPDAYLQLALQLAFFRDRGKFELTYEASMTRLYLLGRTETVRSLTTESSNFVLAMLDKSRSNQDRIKLLRIACEAHQKMYRDGMNGQGIDRHLFGLYVVSKGMGYDCEFLKEVLTLPWTLSTSQQPQQQTPDSPDCGDPKYALKISPGGGFGPVSDKGYGVSYMLPGDLRLFFHISSKKSCHMTDSVRLMDHLFQSLEDMKALYSDANGK